MSDQMTELKPCLFEKSGEQHDVRFIETRPGYGQIGCADCEFWFPSEEEIPKEEAVERWNTREENTCKLIYEEPEHPIHYGKWTCSTCGCWWMHPPYYLATAKYCPNCGSKVIE